MILHDLTKLFDSLNIPKYNKNTNKIDTRIYTNNSGSRVLYKNDDVVIKIQTLILNAPFYMRKNKMLLSQTVINELINFSIFSSLNFPTICKLYGYYFEYDKLCIAQSYYSDSLANHADDKECIDSLLIHIIFTVKYIFQTCTASVHRDLKLDNIMVSETPLKYITYKIYGKIYNVKVVGGIIPVIIDFGSSNVNYKGIVTKRYYVDGFIKNGKIEVVGIDINTKFDLRVLFKKNIEGKNKDQYIYSSEVAQLYYSLYNKNQSVETDVMVKELVKKYEGTLIDVTTE
jgi:serine/threonine protein kinase